MLVQLTGAAPGFDVDRRPRATGVPAASPCARACPTTATPSCPTSPERQRGEGSRGMRRVAMVGAGMTDFGELFDLGIKDMVPMAVSEAVAQRRQGLRPRRHPGGVVRRARHHRRLRHRASWPTPAACSTSRCRASRTPAPPATTPSATARWRSPAACTTWCWWSVPTRCARPPTAQHVLGLDGHDPRHGVGLPARPRRPGQLRAARRPLPARVADRHPRAPRDGGGEEPLPRRHQPEGADALRDHRRAGAERADGRRAVRPVRLHPAERRRGGLHPRREELVDRYTDRPVWVRGIGPRPRPGDAPAQARHDDVPAHGARPPSRPTRWPASDPTTSTSPRCTTASPASS